MKRIFCVLSLLLSAASAAEAQVEWRWANVVTTGNGFYGNLEFRNTNAYGDPNIVAITALMLTASQRVVDRCAPPVSDCFIGGSISYGVGNVQQMDFYAGQTIWRAGYRLLPITNSSSYQLSVPWVASGAPYDHTVVLGCPVPETPTMIGDYGYRTCAADGYDGWVSVDASLNVSDPNPPTGWYGVDDIDVSFSTITLDGLNAMQVVPEPATYALVAIGLGLIAAVKGNRRNSKSLQSKR
ncbi:MAG: PEP-CTERM sorting domain-containing protein [Gemmatimonadaceae bacterium]